MSIVQQNVTKLTNLFIRNQQHTNSLSTEVIHIPTETTHILCGYKRSLQNIFITNL